MRPFGAPAVGVPSCACARRHDGSCRSSDWGRHHHGGAGEAPAPVGSPEQSRARCAPRRLGRGWAASPPGQSRRRTDRRRGRARRDRGRAPGRPVACPSDRMVHVPGLRVARLRASSCPAESAGRGGKARRRARPPMGGCAASRLPAIPPNRPPRARRAPAGWADRRALSTHANGRFTAITRRRSSSMIEWRSSVAST